MKFMSTAFSASSSLMRAWMEFLVWVAPVISASSSLMVLLISSSILATSTCSLTAMDSRSRSFSRDLSFRSFLDASDEAGSGAPRRKPSSSALKSMR